MSGVNLARVTSVVIGSMALGLLLSTGGPAGPASAAMSAAVSAEECAPAHVTQPARPAVLAHFYIWFNASSWNRAKIDFPAAGRYSSDQASVLREQVAQARGAGIDGFIVGWRRTDVLDPRLENLRDIAEQHSFELAVMYQAQDFNRDPLPVPQVRDDLVALADRYADDPVFDLFGDRPLVALSGTWHYSTDELLSIIDPVRDRLTVVATEKDVEGYERVAAAVEGNLYYWSSGDPQRTPGYQKKLVDMAEVVRADCGLWIAPVIPGYDARELGGERVVPRRDGATLRASWEAALATVPDALGVISWNEFSENTHIEPSTRFGTRYLQVLAEFTGAPTPTGELDSSGPQGQGSPARAAAVIGAAIGMVALVAVVGLRRRRAPR